MLISAARRRSQFIAGLRAVADFYERNPGAYYDGARVTLSMYACGASARQIMAAAARAFGRCRKICDEVNFTLAKSFGSRVTVEVFCPRARVCRRIVVGARSEPARTLPAVEELHIPAREVEIVEWRCDPILDAAARGREPES